MVATVLRAFGRCRRITLHGERGQALVMFAFGLTALIALAGIVVDVGMLVYTKSDLQKVSDAAALAGAQDLPSTGTARSTANGYAAANENSATTVAITFSSTYDTNDTITVESQRYVGYTFLKVLGLKGKTVKASAKARAATYVGGIGVLPWGFIAGNDPTSKLLQNACYLGKDSDGLPKFKQNTSCTLKWGAGDNAGGDFGALQLDGSGASDYRDDIKNGSDRAINIGDTLDPKTGNMAGPTDQGIADRLARPAPSGCPGNARNDVLYTGSDGYTRIRPGCENSARIIVIPVVDQIDAQGKSTVLGFAFLYLEGLTPAGSTATPTATATATATSTPSPTATSTATATPTPTKKNGKSAPLLAPGGNGNGNGNGNSGSGQSEVRAEFISFTTELPYGVYKGFDGSGPTVIVLAE